MSFSELKQILLKIGFDFNNYDLSVISCNYEQDSFYLEFTRKE